MSFRREVAIAMIGNNKFLSETKHGEIEYSKTFLGSKTFNSCFNIFKRLVTCFVGHTTVNLRSKPTTSTRKFKKLDVISYFLLEMLSIKFCKLM